MTTVTPNLDASAVFLPWADHFVPKDGMLSAGAVLPCSGTKVDKKRLAATLLAVSFWNLRQAGAIALEPFEKKVLFRTTRQLGVRGLDRAVATPFEATLVGAIDRSDPTKNAVEFVVFRWLGQDSIDPYKVVVDRAGDCLAAAGYGTTEAPVGIGKQVRGHGTFTADCGRLAGLQPSFAALASGWTAFASQEAALHAELLERCAKGVSRRRESSDTDSGGGGMDFD